MKLKTLFKCVSGLAIGSSLIPVGMSFNNKALSLSLSLSNQNVGNLDSSNEITWYIDDDGIVFPADPREVGESVTIPAIVNGKNVTGIRSSAFGINEKLRKVNVEKNNFFKTIGDNAFDSCYSLEEINFPDSLTTIGTNAFRKCNLKNIKLGPNVSNMDSAFADCVPENISISSSNKYFEVHNVYDDYSREIVGQYVTAKTKNVDTDKCVRGLAWGKIVLNLKEIVSKAFEGCLGITNIDLKTEKIYDSAFRRCENIKTITLHEGLKYIGAFAFSYVYECESINIPNSVAEIGGFAFDNNNLKNIYFKWGHSKLEQIYESSHSDTPIERGKIPKWICLFADSNNITNREIYTNVYLPKNASSSLINLYKKTFDGVVAKMNPLSGEYTINGQGLDPSLTYFIYEMSENNLALILAIVFGSISLIWLGGLTAYLVRKLNK
ncbi:MAG: leucine-rich repeat domain-containing protein [Mycoplasma sp.]